MDYEDLYVLLLDDEYGGRIDKHSRRMEGRVTGDSRVYQKHPLAQINNIMSLL